MIRKIINFIKKKKIDKGEELLDFKLYNFTDLFVKNIDKKVEVICSETDQIFLEKLNTKLKDLGEGRIFSSTNLKDKVSVPFLNLAGNSYEKEDWYLFEADFGFIENSRLLISNHPIDGLNFFDLPTKLVIILKKNSILDSLNDCMQGMKDKYNTTDFRVNSLSLSNLSSNFERIILFIKP